MPDDDKEISLRGDLEAAFTADEAPPEDKGAELPPEGPAKAPEGAPPAKTPPEDETPPGPSEKKGAEKGPDGKFKKREVGDVKPDAQIQKELAAEPPQLPKSRAPGSWKPSAREKWAGLPPEIQQEVLRREKDMANGFNEVGNIKKFRDDFHQVIAPYQNIIATEGGNPLKMVNDLFATASVLYHGTPQSKVNTIAAFIKNFGVDLPMLDSALAGDPPKANSGGAGGQDIAAIVNAQVQQALAPILAGQRGNTQALQQEVTSNIEAFAQDPKNEWFEDVKDTMADVLEIAAKQGKTMDLQTAYNRATMMHSEIAEVVADRQLREKAAAASAAAASAKKKAVSVTGAPAKEPAGGENESLRGDILGAIESLGT
jgi:hypothetical protein